jgi:hypothetical protein
VRMLQLTRRPLSSSFWPITELEHPPYSTDLAPNDFSLFSKIKSALKGQRFQDIEDIQRKYDDGCKWFSHNRNSKNVANIGNVVGLSA